MWLLTTFGFFSICKKRQDDKLTIRSWVREDLEKLREKYLPTMGDIEIKNGEHYRYRAKIDKNSLEKALPEILASVTYSNFEKEVARRQSVSRAKLYGSLWKPLKKLTKIDDTNQSRIRFGGVVFNNNGKVLLRAPRGEFDGYKWTFVKAKPSSSENPEQTALRAVKEEFGLEADIFAPIFWNFKGGFTETTYFLMIAQDKRCKPGRYTSELQWAAPNEARRLIKETKNKIGRKRDLEVLDKAVELYETQKSATEEVEPSPIDLKNILNELEIREIKHYGNVTMVPLALKGSNKRQFILISEDEAKDCATITEAGSVNSLILTNISDKPILVLEGEILTSKSQNRMVNDTILIPFNHMSKSIILPSLLISLH